MPDAVLRFALDDGWVPDIRWDKKTLPSYGEGLNLSAKSNHVLNYSFAGWGAAEPQCWVRLHLLQRHGDQPYCNHLHPGHS